MHGSQAHGRGGDRKNTWAGEHLLCDLPRPPAADLDAVHRTQLRHHEVQQKCAQVVHEGDLHKRLTTLHRYVNAPNYRCAAPSSIAEASGGTVTGCKHVDHLDMRHSDGEPGMILRQPTCSSAVTKPPPYSGSGVRCHATPPAVSSWSACTARPNAA